MRILKVDLKTDSGSMAIVSLITRVTSFEPVDNSPPMMTKKVVYRFNIADQSIHKALHSGP